jgi:hypothetical protein
MPAHPQHTAFLSELVPASYVIVMDTEIYGLKIDRYDDIWGGLFALKLIHKMGHRATFGIPLTKHIRNRHDYLRDFRSEMLGAILNNKIYEIVMNMDIESKTYADGYLELAGNLWSNIKRFFTDSIILKYFDKLSKAMNTWIELVDRV